MPPLEVNREAVRVLAVAVGVRQAAREMGLPEATVQAWSARGKWFARPEAPVTARQKQGATIATTYPADALAAIGERSKLALARAGEKAAKHFEKLTGRELAKQSSSYKNVVDAKSKLHGWDTRFQGEGFSLNVLNLGGVVNVDTPEA